MIEHECDDLVWFKCASWYLLFAHSECPTPVPLWVVIVSIVGGILAVGLALLIALKIIIMILQRIEYNDFVKNKVVWGEVWIWFGLKRIGSGLDMGSIFIRYAFLGPKSTL